ncbi:hypothetical protein tinsulaeT_04600 [Thalassotalea insulae]|uniref:Solute-binding protein family 3/N-terminal domain-containing protein n=1 Tax=Thalassotalea insulae TaxID=2056778 RepID=A0ABQ6GR03_9GAMM|nr:transporter substrate-binding domain-containing protein [Thalassotalea insulae]GLX77120.1 hypothetical protein tinsulaeT_04600 [Thalassotalea insulae]
MWLSMNYGICFISLFIFSTVVRAVPVNKESFEQYLPVQIYSEIWPPFQVKDKQGKLTGLATDHVKSAFEQADVPYHILPMRWARALNFIKLKPNALIYSISRTPERESRFHWIAKLGRVNVKLLSLKESNEVISHPSQLTNYVIALKRAEASLDYFLGLGLEPGKHIIFVNNSEQALKLLDIGRVDFYPISAETLQSSLDIIGYSSSKFKYVYYFKALSFDIYIAANKDSDLAFISYINDLFDKCALCNAADASDILRNLN